MAYLLHKSRRDSTRKNALNNPAIKTAEGIVAQATCMGRSMGAMLAVVVCVLTNDYDLYLSRLEMTIPQA